MDDFIKDFSALSNYFNQVEDLGIFNEEEKQALLNERKHLVLEKGDILLEEGHVPGGVYLVKKGIIKLFKVGFTGKEQIIRFVISGDLIGYRSILSDSVIGASAAALTTVEVDFIPERFFIKLLQENSKITFAMLKLISNQLGVASDKITTLAQKTVRERLAEVLLTLEQQLGVDNNGFISIALTREEMANLVGTATESAIRLISEFKQDNFIEAEGRKIKIVNREMLKKLAHIDV